MFARRSGDQFLGQKAKPNVGARKRGPKSADNQTGAVLGPVLGPHFGPRFGANLDLGLEFQTGLQTARGQKERSKFVYARFTKFFREVQHSMDATFARLRGYYKVVGLCSASFAGGNCKCTVQASLSGPCYMACKTSPHFR